jgi:hypothetical protein
MFWLQSCAAASLTGHEVELYSFADSVKRNEPRILRSNFRSVLHFTKYFGVLFLSYKVIFEFIPKAIKKFYITSSLEKEADDQKEVWNALLSLHNELLKMKSECEKEKDEYRGLFLSIARLFVNNEILLRLKGELQQDVRMLEKKIMMVLKETMLVNNQKLNRLLEQRDSYFTKLVQNKK